MTDYSYVESAIVEDDALLNARARADEVGRHPIARGRRRCSRSWPAWPAPRRSSKWGTGVGVSGLWLLAGMTDDGVLTTIDPEPEYQQAAREAFAAADVPLGRTR